MLDEILTTEDGNYRVVAEQALHPESPRDNENLGVMVCGHQRYTLGDSKQTHDGLVGVTDDALRASGPRNTVTYLRTEHGATVVLPLYLHDHSGLSITAGMNLLTDGASIASNGWDVGFLGLIFDTEAARGTEWMGDVEAILRAEVEEYDLYLRGEVYDLRVQMKVTQHITTVSTYPAGSEEVHQSTVVTWVDLDDQPHATVYGDTELGMIAADLLSDCLV